MKNLKLVGLGSVVLLVIVILMVLANTVFAQTQQTKKDDKVIHIPLPQNGKDTTPVVVPVPGPGENVTVIVDVPVRRLRKAVTPAPTYITVHQGSNLRLRWGVGMNILMLVGSAPELTAVTGSLVGEIGYSDSPWRLQGRVNLGKCQDNYLAVGGELAALRRLTKRFWAGGAGAVLYCADTDAHPRELGKRRLVGAAVKVAYKEEYAYSAVAVELSMGVDVETVPVPGGRDNGMAGNIGLSVSYLF